MRWLAIIALAGCRFSSPQTGGDDSAPPPGDGPVVVDAPADAFHGTSARYNLGGPSYTSSSNENAGTWAADNSVLAGGICTGTPAGGSMPAFLAPPGTTTINGTMDTPLFKKLILGDPIRCQIDSLPTGHYNVRLLFAELYRGGPPCQGVIGPRKVTISIQGSVVATNFDVIATGGGCAAATGITVGSGHAFDQTYPAKVDNGQLSITLAKGTATDFAVVSAIEIVQMDPDD